MDRSRRPGGWAPQVHRDGRYNLAAMPSVPNPHDRQLRAKFGSDLPAVVLERVDTATESELERTLVATSLDEVLAGD